ncbi:ATP-binding response regulator [Anatilimnocola floriformis]|uniref:ATP-binding response regulator n=1 Tax=Anatilimnocola floriformis TaxID=2948575 RepID=UPI0020C36745|nr:ATP-binding protein [Anatilimnocola floriformis]
MSSAPQMSLTAEEKRVLILAPTKKDGEVSVSLLAQAGIPALACAALSSLIDELRIGAGALVITEDSLTRNFQSPLYAALHDQPTWSELPIIALVRNSTDGAISKQLKLLGHVTLVERPVLLRTFLSAIQTALWARHRQYQNRDLLEKERLAREEAERTSRLKDEFIATLSHELRTPLSAILGWSQLLGRGLLDENESQEAVASIERNARAQTQLIEDLLDMSRIISGKMRLDVQIIEPNMFIEAAIATVRPAAAAKEIRLNTQFDAKVGTVLGDPSRLQQVIWNLLSNAIKFTPMHGEVRITVRRLNSHLEIAIRDSGQGISAEFLPYVFDRFRQADGSTTRRVGGLGLGLAIVKQLIELHGGQIEAQSEGEGLGSSFVVSLPVNSSLLAMQPRERRSPSRFNETRAPEFQSLQGIKILAVDDERDALGVLARVLTMCGADVRTGTSAAEAITLCDNFHPDLLISDIGMPEVDGCELIRMLRATSHQLPAIALTAFARSEDRTRSLRAGFSAHLSKPVEPAELVATVAALTSRK